ncbi:hypothetical protein [Pontibaca salina]|uniref:Uncharacterized protein n=1 Tax=Pontibaca salina TaxID=2795731 RepID=A0A934M0W9_9RHOB|nr:hypothetical protein [Pontibaca salina]MBI6629081.1 hypothetical protein [Pontibaca salina]
MDAFQLGEDALTVGKSIQTAADAMKKSLTVLLVGSLFLAGCNSRLNPGNWFGAGQSVATTPETAANPLIPQRSGMLSRPPEVDRSERIATISDLVVERQPGGAIIRATGIGARQGAFEARLAPTNPDLLSEDGVMTFDFRLLYPQSPTPVGTEWSRSVTAAYTVTNQQLEGVRAIRVRGAQNTQEARR